MHPFRTGKLEEAGKDQNVADSLNKSYPLHLFYLFDTGERYIIIDI